MRATQKDSERARAAMRDGYTHIQTVVSSWRGTTYFRFFPLAQVQPGIDTNPDGRYYGQTEKQFEAEIPDASPILHADFKSY